MTGGVSIAVRINARTSGGGYTFASNLLRALQSEPRCAGVTAFVVGESASLDLPEGLNIVEVEAKASTIRRHLSRKETLQAPNGVRVDALLCPGAEFAGLSGGPSIFWPLTVAPFEVDQGELGVRVRWRLRLLRYFVERNVREADALIFSSRHALKLHDPPDNTPTAVIWPAPGTTQVATRTVVGGRVQRPYILFVSHLYPYKMVVELLTGYAKAVRAHHLPHDLVIAGSATHAGYYEDILKTVARHGLSDRVHLLGAVGEPELGALYAGASAFVFPSAMENAGSYALLDAYAHGLPVMASNLSSMPEMCAESAVYFDPRDTSQVAEVLGETLADDQKMTRLREKSLARAADFPSWEDIAGKTLDFVIDLLH